MTVKKWLMGYTIIAVMAALFTQLPYRFFTDGMWYMWFLGISAMVMGVGPSILAFQQNKPENTRNDTYLLDVFKYSVFFTIIHFIVTRVVEFLQCRGEGFCGIFSFFSTLGVLGIQIISMLVVGVVLVLRDRKYKKENSSSLNTDPRTNQKYVPIVLSLVIVIIFSTLYWNIQNSIEHDQRAQISSPPSELPVDIASDSGHEADSLSEPLFFESTEYGFSISFPENWDHVEQLNDSMLFSDGNTHLRVVYAQSAKAKESFIPPIASYTISPVDPVYHTISEYEFIELIWGDHPNTPESKPVAYTMRPLNEFPRNGYYYAIVAHVDQGTISIDEVREIMKTFRLLPIPQEDTVEWGMCSSEFGFTYKYPSGWKFWKRAIGDFIEGSCKPATGHINISPNIYESNEGIQMYISNKTTQPHTIIQSKDFSSLDEYLSLDLLSNNVSSSTIVKEFEIDSVPAVLQRNGDVVTYFDDSIIRVSRSNGLDDTVFNAFINAIDFVE